MAHLATLPVIVVVIATCIAAVTDLWKFKVYNALTIPLLVTGVAYHAYHDGWHGLGFSLIGIALGFGILIGLYVLGGVGAGDVKLLAAIGAWLGFTSTLYVFVVAGLAAGAYAVVVLCLRGGFASVASEALIIWYQARNLAAHLGADETIEEVLKRDDHRRRLIPFAAILAIGVVAVVLWWGA